MPDPEKTPGPCKQDSVRRLARPAVALAGVIVFQLLFAGRSHHLVLHQATGAALAALSGGPVHAAGIAGPKGESLLIQTAASTGTAGVLTKEFATAAAALETPPRVRDLAPLPASDPAGDSLFFLVIVWMLGGYVAATAVGVMLGGMRGPGPRQAAIRLGLLAGYAVLSGLLGVLLIGPALGVVPGYSLSLAGALLTLAATAWRRHRPASRAPQHAAQAAAAASLAA